MPMKKLLSLLLTFSLVLSIAACGNSGSESDRSSEPSSVISGQASESDGAAEPGDSNADANLSDTNSGEQTNHILVAYFSWADNAILAEGVDAVTSPSVDSPGNVQQLAGWVQEETGGELFSIQVTDPYPSDWDECLARANQERGDQARPELIANVENMEQYDTVFLGYPNWWYGVPMALLSFIEQNDLSGKQVYLFCSHGTGGLANSVEQITDAAPAAVISDNIFHCYEEDAASSQEDIRNWIAELGY